MPCRVLVIEDKQSAADQLCRLLKELEGELGMSIDVKLLVRDHLDEFQAVMEKWYNVSGFPISQEFKFDLTSLDLMFKSTPDMIETDGGEQLLAWLDDRKISPHLGRMVVRSNKPSDSLARRPGVVFAQKHNDFEKGQWRDLLRQV